MVEYLPGIHKALGSNPQNHKGKGRRREGTEAGRKELKISLLLLSAMSIPPGSVWKSGSLPLLPAFTSKTLRAKGVPTETLPHPHPAPKTIQNLLAPQPLWLTGRPGWPSFQASSASLGSLALPVCDMSVCGLLCPRDDLCRLLSVDILCCVGKMQDGSADSSQSKGNRSRGALESHRDRDSLGTGGERTHTRGELWHLWGCGCDSHDTGEDKQV